MSRLPTAVKPTHYDLDLALDLEALTFGGSAVAHLEVSQQTVSIVLHAKDLTITAAKITDASPTQSTIDIPTSTIAADAETQTITISLPTPLAPGSKVLLHLSFTGVIGRHGGTPGFGWTPYKTGSGEEKHAFSTECEPIGARRIFPCFDEPAFKATISSTLSINADLTALSNMDVASSEMTTSEDGAIKKVFKFNKTPPMATYLVCFVIGDFEFIESTQHRFPVRVYALKGSNVQRGTRMLQVAADALGYCETLFGVEYPLPKMDLVALPEAGGLENWGCIVFGERFMLLDPETTAAKSWQMATETLCHEIAHQWFGNLVTMVWWDDLWLNEAFAQWVGFYVVDKIFPEWNYWLHFVAGDPDPEAMAFYQGALDMDSTRASHPIYNPNASPHRFGELFDNITYMKGASLLRMLYHYLGTDCFMSGVQVYVKRHALGNATHNDLWDAFATATGKDVTMLMGAWTKHVGYPLVSVTEEPESGTITLEQHRYLQSVEVTAEEDQVSFPIPLNLITTGTLDVESLLLTERRQTYPVAAKGLEFYKLNANQIGLYRVAYPPSRLQVLCDQLSSPCLSPEDRVGLVSDTHALVSSALSTSIQTTDLLDLMLAFHTHSEENFLVWRQIFFTFAKLKQAFMFSSPEVASALHKFHEHMVLPNCLPAEEKQVWNISAADAVQVQNAKALFFSQAASYTPISEVAGEIFDKFNAGDTKAFHPNIRKHVFQAVMQDPGRYETIYKLAHATKDPEMRTDAFVALGFARSSAAIAQSLALMTDANAPFNPLEKWFLLNAIQTHRAGAEAAWVWLTENWTVLQDKESSRVLEWYTASCTGSLSTSQQLAEVAAFANSGSVKVCCKDRAMS